MEKTPEDTSLTEDAHSSRRAIDAPCEIQRHRYNFDIALCTEGKRLLIEMSLCIHLLHLHDRCSRAARLVKVFAARYRLHRADPALWCAVIFDRTVAVDCVHVSVVSL